MFWKNKIKIRQARVKDIPQILEVEKASWKEKAATKEMFESRIKTFPEGTLVACDGNKIVGVIVTEIVNYNPEEKTLNWYEITDNGYIKNIHNPKGDTLYGVDLSVLPNYQNREIGRKLMEMVGRLIIKRNFKKGMLGARALFYHKFCDKISIEEYIDIEKAKKKGIPPDPELIFWQKKYWGVAFKILKIIPDYFQDSESLNYGILLIWNNPFYNKWYRNIAAKFFRP